MADSAQQPRLHPKGHYALALAKLGLRVFPLRPNTKLPAITEWQQRATTDERTIRIWWAQADYNIGIATGRADDDKTGRYLVAFDYDVKSGKVGGKTLKQHRLLGLTETMTITTASGGTITLFWSDVEVHNSVNRVAEHVDVRGWHGLVVGPGSTINGRAYTQNENGFATPQALPPELLEQVQRTASSSHAPRDDTAVDPALLNSEAAIERARSYLVNDAPQAIEGSGGDHTTLVVACTVRDFGITESCCLDLMSEWYNEQKCSPPWSLDDTDDSLSAKVKNAYKYAKNTIGARNAQIEFADVIELHKARSEPPRSPPTNELPETLRNPPGLVGEIAHWITATARYPQQPLSIGAALTIVGTAAGRLLAGPTLSGTQLYVIGLAPSGAGKDHPRKQITVILTAAGMVAVLGPSEFVSMPAFYNRLSRAPLTLCAMDEIGTFLGRINDPNATGWEKAVGGAMRTAWGSSFSLMPVPEWANKQLVPIYAPALSTFGVDTPGQFYRGLSGADVVNGGLNRNLVIETAIRPPEQTPQLDPTVVPETIVKGLQGIYRNAAHSFEVSIGETSIPVERRLAITAKAEAIRKDLVHEVQAMGDAKPALEPFLARTAENAIRVATILAIGQGNMTVHVADMTWARDFAMWSSQRMIEGAGLYIAESKFQAMANAVKRVLKAKGERVPGWVLKRALEHKYPTREVEDVLSSLIETRTVRVDEIKSTKQGGRPGRAYTLRTDPD